MKPYCVVFADAFAHASFSKLRGDSLRGYSLYKLTPGIAYSSNLHYQIFQGKTPDEVGFFTDYLFIPGSQPHRVGKVSAICDKYESVNNIVRFARKKICKRYDNIPFCESHAFRHAGSYLFQQGSRLEIFGVPADIVSDSDVEAAFEKALSLIHEGSAHVLVALNELDELGHEFGSAGREYELAAMDVVSRSQELFDKFMTLHPEGACVLISDHGMAEERAAVNVIDGLQERFGNPGADYFFFCDSVYLRIWSDRVDVLNSIRDYLSDIDVLEKITAPERERFGVTMREFGDEIYRLKQGYVFKPNCFSSILKRSPLGIHGYMEHSSDASGIVVSNRELDAGDCISARDVYELCVAMLRK